MGKDQLKELKTLQKENKQLRRAVAELTLDKPILRVAAKGNFQALYAAAKALIGSVTSLVSQSAEPVGYWVNTAPPSVMFQRAFKVSNRWLRT